MRALSRYQFTTLLGGCGIFFWSLTAWMAMNLSNIPPFEFLMITQGITFLSAIARLSYKKSWHTTKQPLIFWILGSICVPLNLLGYFISFRYIDPALADLIYYMYPIHVFMISSLFLPGVFSIRGLMGCLLCFMGIYVLCYEDISLFFHTVRWEGMFFAILASLSWAAYTLGTKAYQNTPFEMAGLFFGVGSFFAALLHFWGEAFVTPSFMEMIYMLIWALIVQSLAINLWEIGIKQGNFELLNALSYSIPILSVLFLVIGGYTPFTLNLVGAIIIVTLGIALSQNSLNATEQKALSNSDQESST